MKVHVVARVNTYDSWSFFITRDHGLKGDGYPLFQDRVNSLQHSEGDFQPLRGERKLFPLTTLQALV